MPYSNKQMLRDANGDLIPQYWDITAGEFKPLTGQGGANDVRLTGSIVEEEVFSGLSIRDTETKSGIFYPVGLIKSIHIQNNHDVNIQVQLRGLEGRNFYDANTDGQSDLLFRKTISNARYNYIVIDKTHDGWEKIERVFNSQMRFMVKASETPTEGSISLFVVMGGS